MIFQLLLSVLIKWSPTFLQILLQFHMVSCPPEPKPKQQQQQQDKAADVSRFPVVLNEDIEELKSKDVWYTKTRMGQNTIGTIMKSMASCLMTNKKITNHSVRKTLVAKLKKSGQSRHVICEITGHSRESSLDDYDEIDENQRKELSDIISGFSKASSENSASESSKVNQNTTNGTASNQATAVKQRAPLSSIPHIQQQSQMYQAMGFNPVFQPAGFPGFQPCFASQYKAAFASSSVSVPAQNYSGCTFNFSYSKEAKKSPKPQKKQRVYIIESDDED